MSGMVTNIVKMRPKVVVTLNDAARFKTAMKMLKTHCDLTIPVCQSEGVDGLFCIYSDTVDCQLLQAAGPQLKVVSTMSVGYDNVDVAECKRRGIAVGHTPDALTDTVAELTISLLLATGRRIKEALAAATSGEWPSSFCPLWMCGKDLRGSTVGIVGLGRIGAAVVARLRPFNPQRILYTSRNASPFAGDVGAECPIYRPT